MAKPPGNPAQAWLATQLGVDLDPELLVLALTHRSFANEHGGVPTNERLEFLGDAVLGLVTAAELFRAYPDRPESELTKMRAAVVAQRPLADVAREFGLGKFLLLGKGERDTGGRDKDSILSDAIEALIGAVYLSHGLDGATAFVHKLIGRQLANLGAGGHTGDLKSDLVEFCAARGFPPPEYQVTSIGPAHALRFTATVEVGGAVGVGEGSSKKRAEMEAASAVLTKLGTGEPGRDHSGNH